LGIWDEFYGSGKVGARKGKGKQRADAEEEDVSALQALILQRQKARSGFLDNLAAKYMDMDEKEGLGKKGAKGKKRKKVTEPEDAGETGSPLKKRRSALPETDEEMSESTRSKPATTKAKASRGKGRGRAKKAN